MKSENTPRYLYYVYLCIIYYIYICIYMLQHITGKNKNIIQDSSEMNVAMCSYYDSVYIIILYIFCYFNVITQLKMT